MKDSGIDKIPMSPEARKDRTMEALRQIVLRGSELRPLILAHEDLHWIDTSSEEVLKYYQNINPIAGKGLAARYIGEILFKIDDQIGSEGEKWAKKAIEADKFVVNEFIFRFAQ